MLHLPPLLPTKHGAVTVPLAPPAGRVRGRDVFTPLHPGQPRLLGAGSTHGRGRLRAVTSGRGTVTNPEARTGSSCLQSQCLLLAKKYTLFFFCCRCCYSFVVVFKVMCFPFCAVGSGGLFRSNVNTATVCAPSERVPGLVIAACSSQ